MRGTVLQGALRVPYTWRCSIHIPAGSVGTYNNDFSLVEDSAPVSRRLFSTDVSFTVNFVDISGGNMLLTDFLDPVVPCNISLCAEVEMLER